MRRRQFLVLSAASIGGVLVYSLDRRASRLFAQEKATQTLKIPLRFFTEEEALIVAAAAARIFPTDDSGPGAKEAGVVIYIDRQLAGPYGRDRYRYTQGPFDETAPREFGYQGKATPSETYREGLKGLKGFDTTFSRRAGQKAATDRKHALFCSAARKHDRGHVLRSRSRRQRGYGRLATGRISRPAHEQLRRPDQALWRSVPPQAHQPRAIHRTKSSHQRGRGSGPKS